MTLQQGARELAEYFQTHPEIWMRNKKTGVMLQGPTVTAEQIWNFDSHGELFHIVQWHMAVFPERAAEWGEAQ